VHSGKKWCGCEGWLFEDARGRPEQGVCWVWNSCCVDAKAHAVCSRSLWDHTINKLVQEASMQGLGRDFKHFCQRGQRCTHALCSLIITRVLGGECNRMSVGTV
jgi:hypothetical protein